MSGCRHLHEDGTCRRYPPVMIARNGTYRTEWPKPPEGCVCGERAPKPKKRANPAPDAPTEAQRGKSSKPKEGGE